MAGLGWLDSHTNAASTHLVLRIDGGLGLVRLNAAVGLAWRVLRIDGGLGLVRLFLLDLYLLFIVAD